MPTSRDNARALALVARFGRIGTAFQALSPGMSHWFDDIDGRGADARGVVAYVDTGDAWVAAGEPIASPDDVIVVAERFVAAAQRSGKRASFFGTEGVLASSPHFQRFHLGEQPVWDPQQWASHVAAHRSLREQVRRTRAKQVDVRELSVAEATAAPMRAHIESVVRHWLASRPMPPMHFLVEVAPLAWLEHRRLFVAERLGVVVGVCSLSPVRARGGWLFEHLLRDPSAPNGTTERMVDAAMRALAADGVRWATLGLAPLAGPIPRWLRLMRSASRPLYNFDGLAAFKRKLRPQHWEPIYLAFPARASRLASVLAGAMALVDGLRAFAGGPLWRFGVRTALRGPQPLLTMLERLLLPWTLMLALAPTAPWFPSSVVQGAWVVFDVVLFGLLRFVRQHADGSVREGLMRVVAGAVTLDAVLTGWQALTWNRPRITAWWDGALVLLACMGPLLSAPTLWGAAKRLARLRVGALSR